jgi:leukotriene-A4 hydrolase
VHGSGLPDNAPVWTSASFALVDRQVEALVASGVAVDLDTAGWSPYEWIHFIHALPRDSGPSLPAQVDEAFRLTETRNDEILVAWLQCAVESGYAFESAHVDDAVADFLTRQGRVKYLRPLYESLVRTERGAARAREIYAAARPGYHPVATGVVDRILDEA